MANYELTKAALEDLYTIWEYTLETWSEKQADKYYSQLIASFNDIASIPEQSGRAYDEIMPGLRGMRIGHHIVFFVHRQNKVTIARILHERMDFKRHLIVGVARK